MEVYKLITQTDPKSPISEAFRTLRTNIQFSNIDEEIRSIVFTSTTVEEGKTTVAANLASSFAMEGKRVLIVDVDMRRPRLNEIFKLPNNQGLTNILMGEKSLEEVGFKGQDGSETLTILTSGPLPPNPAELISSKKMKAFLDQAREDYDMVILDSPPVGILTDAAILSTLVDGTILVVEAEETELEEAMRAKELLMKVDANIIGSVLNKLPVDKRGSYSYSYKNYGNYYGEE